MKKSKVSTNQFTTVTPLSKALAITLFVALPFIGFYYGMKYQKAITTPPEIKLMDKAPLNMANPASKHCANKGGRLEIRSDKAGAQTGYCHLNGKTCEEWQFFRSGRCQ